MPRTPFDTQARLKAWEIIEREGFTALPIDPLRIVSRHGIELYTYTQFANMCNRTREHIVNEYDEDGFLFPLEFEADVQKYCIVYNENKDPERINWTIMHELCHYFLDHVKTKEDVLTRQKADKDVLDKQADALCARLFAPTVVLHMCNVSSAKEIAELCGISYRAAYLRWEHLKKARHYKKFLELKQERNIIGQFAPFICRYLCYKQDD